MAKANPESADPSPQSVMSDTKDSNPPTSMPAPETRSTTVSTSSSNNADPFASPISSRAPSRVSFDINTLARNATEPVPIIPPQHLQSILNSPRSTNSSISVRSSAIRFPGIPPSSSVLKSKAPRMRSHMISNDNPAPKPWNDKPNPRARFAYLLVYACILFGLAGGAVQSYFAVKHVRLDKHPMCLVLDENFDGTEDSVFGEGGSFFREVNMDGFGNGEFEMATASRNNSFIKDGMLYIVPTLTSDNLGEAAIFDGTVYNIIGCTFNITHPDNGFIMSNGQRVFDSAGYARACSAVSNITTGSIINPVQSARLTTRNSANIKFGRVEIRAKMPNGDWLWPAMWMLPTENVYGPWPLSGEIDIVESRGNGIKYTNRGSNYVQGSLNWGPTPELNAVSKTYSWWTEKRTSFGAGFHTYVLEWTETFLRIYVDTRLHTLLDLRFNVPFFKRGDFPEIISKDGGIVALPNPWINGTNATPFDQNFYLILNVAVGSTNGWFPEVQGDKPWLDRSANPMRDFALAQNQWYPTWPSNVEDRGLVVDYVKMWTHC